MNETEKAEVRAIKAYIIEAKKSHDREMDALLDRLNRLYREPQKPSRKIPRTPEEYRQAYRALRP